jgi:putative hydrolase of the HAD superfamily
MYLSHRIHKRKPDAEIFEYVLKDSDLQMEETCFLDDSKQHVEGANRVGLTSYLLMPGGLIEWSKNLMS